MIYDLYITNSVFDRNAFNVLCNQLMEQLNNQKFSDFDLHFALTGDAADCYQNSTTGPIQTVQFITDDSTIYFWLSANLKKIWTNLVQYQLFEERLICFFDHIVIEILKSESPISTTDINGIFIA